MKLGTMWEMLGGASAPTTLKAMGFMADVHRVSWLAAASRRGVLERMAGAGCTVEELAEHLGAPDAGREALSSWLQHGVLLKEIARRDGRFTPRSGLAKAIASGESPALAAFVEALVDVHMRGIYGALDALDGSRGLSSLNHELVARVSEITGPLLREIIDSEVPRTGALRMLELGCGQAGLLRYACRRNPALTGIGVDLSPEVVEVARGLIEAEGLDQRAEARAGDLRRVELDGQFDRVTLCNLLYYFRPEDRGEVLAAAARWLAPGGRLIVAGSCRGGSIGNNMLDVWFSAMPDAGPLPTPDALAEGIEAAGLQVVVRKRMMPGEEFWLLVGERA